MENLYMLNPFVAWWSDFNRWKFPNSLKWIEPRGWDLMRNYIPFNKNAKNTKSGSFRFRSLIFICRLLSTERQRLNYHHVVNLKRTQEQFEHWFANREILNAKPI